MTQLEHSNNNNLMLKLMVIAAFTAIFVASPVIVTFPQAAAAQEQQQLNQSGASEGGNVTGGGITAPENATSTNASSTSTNITIPTATNATATSTGAAQQQQSFMIDTDMGKPVLYLINPLTDQLITVDLTQDPKYPGGMPLHTLITKDGKKAYLSTMSSDTEPASILALQIGTIDWNTGKADVQ